LDGENGAGKHGDERYDYRGIRAYLKHLREIQVWSVWWTNQRDERTSQEDPRTPPSLGGVDQKLTESLYGVENIHADKRGTIV
jgi:hypothetical protein